MRLVTAAQMREADRTAREEWGLSASILMENAGACVVGTLTAQWGDPSNRRVLVLCGKGGNGGDGLVAARHLSIQGADVQVIVLAREEDVQGETAVNLKIAQRMSLPVLFAPTPQDVHNLAALFAFSEWVVDSIFGVGGKPAASARSRTPLVEPAAAAVNLLNQLGKKVLAIDIPSGLDPDTGAISQPTVNADVTVTLGAAKIGLFSYPGAASAGKIVVADIGMPPGVWDQIATNVSLVTPADVTPRLPRRWPEAHKGSAGRLLIIAGSPGLTGAASLAAAAAARAGAGYVTLAVPDRILPVIETKLTEIVKKGFPSDRSGVFSPKSIRGLVSLAAESDAIALGPGLGTGLGIRGVVTKLLSETRVPAVVDADALNAIAEAHFAPKGAHHWVLTPHPGEAAKLLGTKTETIQGDRLGAARKLAEKYGSVAVLKGARTVIGDGKRSLVNPTGGPALATAGTGDVLTGIVGAFLAQGLPPIDAAICGPYLHGAAGDLAAADGGTLSVVAADLLNRLPQALRSMGA